MNKKAFTLIEVMGVVTIMGLITLLIAPSIVNQIRNSKNKVDEVTQQLIYSATDLYLDNKERDYPKNNGSVYCVKLEQLVEDGKLSSPILDSSGNEISLDREVAVEITKNSYHYTIPNICVNKIGVESLTVSNEEITVEVDSSKTVTTTISPSNATNQELLWESSDESIATVENGVITGINEGDVTITVSTTDGSDISKNINVTVKPPIMTSTNNCIKAGNKCTDDEIKAGIKVSVAVSDSQSYDFYVVSDTTTEMTLIMSENIGGKVAWHSARDASQGPTTLISALKELTDEEWSNIPTKEYIYSGLGYDGTSTMYDDITETMKVRLLTYAEATLYQDTTVDIGAPYIYAGDHYWTSTANESNTAYCITGTKWLSYLYVNDSSECGIRPVIEMTKNT